MGAQRPVLGLLVSMVDRYGQASIVGHPVQLIGPDQEFRNPYREKYGADPVSDLADLEIHAYAGVRPDDIITDCDRGYWGFSVAVTPHQIDTVDQAMGIARVLRRIARGLERIEQAEGYAGEDFAAYLLRVARVLRLTHIYVRNPTTVQAQTGQRWRLVNGAELQTWLAGALAAVKRGQPHDYLMK